MSVRYYRTNMIKLVRKVLRNFGKKCINKALCMLTLNAIFSLFDILLRSTGSNQYKIIL